MNNQHNFVVIYASHELAQHCVDTLPAMTEELKYIEATLAKRCCKKCREYKRLQQDYDNLLNDIMLAHEIIEASIPF